ncbi:MAG TPA: hypothetical protein PL168_11165 [Methanobacterium sp.]|nr:hypothetical protein [Methanobacterium sp.]
MKGKNHHSTSAHVDLRLKKRLQTYLVFILIMVAVIIYEVFTGVFMVSWAIGGILIGFGVGILASRMYHLSWDDETNLVIGHIDKIGAVILICYLIFIFTRTYFLQQWVQGAPLTALILSLTTGSLLGNMMSTGRGIRKILKTLKILV